ncbi:hypothetical protein [Hydrogenimonas sp.]
MNFKEIRLIRMLIWVLLYLLLVFSFIFILVIPVVKAYKGVNSDYVDVKARHMAVKNEHDTVFERLKSLQAKYRKVIAAFENRWDEKRFMEQARKYFLQVRLMPVESNVSDPNYKIYEINALTKMESPQNFYRFLESFPSIPFVLQADFPIAFKAHGSDEIEGIFRIRVYEEKKGVESNRSRESVLNR